MSSLSSSAAPRGQDFLRPYVPPARKSGDGPRPRDIQLSLAIQAGDTAAVHELAQTGRGLVANWVEHYLPKVRSITEDDLWQEGYIALVYAAQEYRPEEGVCFSTYAYKWIGWHFSRVADYHNRIFRWTPKGVKPKRVPLSGVNRCAKEEARPDPFAEDRATFWRFLGTFPYRTQLALTLRAEGLTLEAIGLHLGMTKEGVRQRLGIAIKKFRKLCILNGVTIDGA